MKVPMPPNVPASHMPGHVASIRYLCISAMLFVGLACGCASSPHGISTKNRETIAALNATANDTTAAPDARCAAVFSLFRQFIKPGSTPGDIHEVLTDTTWLAQSKVIGIYFLGGPIPVKCKFETETPFELFVLPDIKPPDGRPPNLGYQVWFTLDGGDSRSAESATGILSGQPPMDSKARLKALTLCYPDGSSEGFKKSGWKKLNLDGTVSP